MVNVSPYYRGAGAEFFVDRLLFREHPTWIHHEFLTSEKCL
jgi:hypothetical protein